MSALDAGTERPSPVPAVKAVPFLGIAAQLPLVLLLPAALVYFAHRNLVAAPRWGKAQWGIRGCLAPYQKPDGRVVRVLDSGTLIIDLFTGDAVAPGTSFEAYGLGMPAPGNDARAVSPTPGKASIEVVRVLPGYSECRVIRLTRGEGIEVGDLLYKRVRR